MPYDGAPVPDIQVQREQTARSYMGDRYTQLANYSRTIVPSVEPGVLGRGLPLRRDVSAEPPRFYDFQSTAPQSQYGAAGRLESLTRELDAMVDLPAALTAIGKHQAKETSLYLN